MLKITKRTEHREITVEEFAKMKSAKPYKSWRQTGKTCNFLLIFGGSAMIFSEQAIEINWTSEQCEEYIKENDCKFEIEDVKRKYRGISDEELPFVVVATKIRTNFFKGYPGLMERIDREKAFACKHGYVRSIFGHTRKEIELMLQGEWDKRNLSGMLRNIANISANTEIQNMEASITKRVMYEFQMWLKEHDYKTRLMNEIHDSIDLYLYKKEASIVLPKLKELCERDLIELSSSPIKLKVDCEISDITKGQYYKGGASPESFDIKW